jgi:hypothetical protein
MVTVFAHVVEVLQDSVMANPKEICAYVMLASGTDTLPQLSLVSVTLPGTCTFCELTARLS